MKPEYPKHIVSGKGIDGVYDKSINEIIALKKENEDLNKQITAIQVLNDKLNERVDFL